MLRTLRGALLLGVAVLASAGLVHARVGEGAYEPHQRVPVLVNNVGVSATREAHAQEERRSKAHVVCQWDAHHSARSLSDCRSILLPLLQPIHNPAESYQFYSLPFCAPKDGGEADRHSRNDNNLGEVLAGDRRRKALYDLRYGVDIQW